MSKPVLLIADPDIMRRNGAFRRCADLDIHVLGATGLDDALRLAQDHRPDRVAIASDLAIHPGFGLLSDLLMRLRARVVIYGPPRPGLTLFRTVQPEQLVAALLGDLLASRTLTPSLDAPGDSDDVPDLILIGASTGGITALEAVLCAFPPDCPPTLVVQHIRPGFVDGLIRRLDKLLAPNVRAAEDEAPLRRGTILVAADSDRHLRLILRGGLRTRLRDEPPVSGHRPSVDVLFGDGAKLAPGLDVRAALLTGMGADGAQGMCDLRRAGAQTIAQDRDSSVVWGMPRVAVEMGGACEVLPLVRIGQALLRPVQASRARSSA